MYSWSTGMDLPTRSFRLQKISLWSPEKMSAENRRSSMPSNMPTPVIRSLIRRRADIIQAWASEIWSRIHAVWSMQVPACMQDRRRRSRLCIPTSHWNIMTRSTKNPLCSAWSSRQPWRISAARTGMRWKTNICRIFPMSMKTVLP